MNLSMRDKKILLMFLGVGVFAAGYFFGYRPQMEEAQSIQASTEPLKTRLDDLLKLAGLTGIFICRRQKISMQRSVNIPLHFRQISVLKTESYFP